MRLLALALLCLPAAAYPQEAEPISRQILETLLEPLLTAFGILLSAIITWVAVTIQRKTSLVIEAAHRDALHSAIMSGVSAAAARIGAGARPQDLVQEGIAYARASVPDAIRALRPGVEVLTDLALAKAEERLGLRKPGSSPVPIADPFPFPRKGL